MQTSRNTIQMLTLGQFQRLIITNMKHYDCLFISLLPTILEWAGESWKALDAASKEPFEILAREDKKRHAIDMMSYVPPSGIVDNTKEAKRKRNKKAADAPRG